MKYFILSMALLALVTTFGCGSLIGSSELTPEEKQEIIAYARRFLTKSRIKLSPQDKATVIRNKPKMQVHYRGYRQGTVIITWDIGELRSIIIKGEGHFFEKSCQWRISIINKESFQLDK